MNIVMLCNLGMSTGMMVKKLEQRHKNYIITRQRDCCEKRQSFFRCAPGGARFQRVKGPNQPGNEKDITEGMGVKGNLKRQRTAETLGSDTI